MKVAVESLLGLNPKGRASHELLRLGGLALSIENELKIRREI